MYDDHLKAEGLISAALELTAYQQQTGSAQSRPTHGVFGFRMGQAKVDVQFSSEAARIDLNTAPKQLLSGLLATLGARPDTADVYADRIIGWRTPQQGNKDAVFRVQDGTFGLSTALWQVPSPERAIAGARSPDIAC